MTSDDLVPQILAAIEETEQEAEEMILSAPPGYGKTTGRFDDPHLAIRRCAADRKIVELFQYRAARYAEAERCSGTNKYRRKAAYYAMSEVIRLLADSYGVAPAPEPVNTQETTR